jgi:hypothetical protein
MYRRSLTVFAGLAVVACVALPASEPAGAARKHGHHPPRPHGPVIHVSPSRGLVNAQTITVSGTGLPKTHDGSIHTWFVALCVPKAAKVKNLDPDYSPYCSPTVVESLHVLPGGTFSAPFIVATGKVGNGHCGTPGHFACLVAVGTGLGQHTTVSVTFSKSTAPAKGTTTTTKP